ncbi:MAG: DUF4823 domain-containing protein [Syntrophorhabdaceae bacterium]
MRSARFGLLYSIGFLLLLVNACAYVQNSVGPDNSPYERPDLQDKLCIMQPPDIAHGSKVYFSAGKSDPESTVAYRLFTSVSEKRPSVILIETSNEEQAIQRCSSNGAKYLFSPLIRQWQGRASQLSFMRNTAEIEIRLIKVESRELVRSVIFEARSGWFNAGWNDPAGLLTTDSFKQSINDLID